MSNKNIYNTRRWFKLRKAILRRDKGLCQHCLIDEQYTAGNQIDHKKPMADYPEINPYDPENLQTLCESCHQTKTADEHKQRALKRNVGWIEV